MNVLQIFISFIIFSLFSSLVSAGLVLNPQRIVVLDRERTSSLELLNTSDEIARYQIYFEHKKMLEDGSIVDISESDEEHIRAGDMIRYSPRRVDIKSKGSQTIRLAIRRPKNLPDGEYISHLALKQIPNKQAPIVNDINNDASLEKELSLKVQPILKIAIPVIVRKGELHASAALSDISNVHVNDASAYIQFTLGRDGNRSLYGDVEIYELDAGANPGARVGFAKGIALYDPTLFRLVRVQVNPSILVPGKKLLLRFDEKGRYGGNNLVEQVFTVVN